MHVRFPPQPVVVRRKRKRTTTGYLLSTRWVAQASRLACWTKAGWGNNMVGSMKRFVRVMVWGAVGMAALHTLLAVTVGASFYRRVPVNNDPLTNSVSVTSISSNRLTLADGRSLIILGYPAEILGQELRDSGGRIELDSDDSRLPYVYVKRKRFICGTGAPAVVIPLFRSEYSRFYRHPLGLGEFQ
jgi:hypothetical protein